MQINKADFDVSTLDDEIRVDELCKGLLMAYYESLKEAGIDPAQATIFANGADYFVRDFVIAVKQRNLFSERPGLVRQFAGNWYIMNTLDPAVEYLAGSLQGVAGFYRFLAAQGLVSGEFCQQMEEECADLPYYESRIESFWAITEDGYLAWEKGCSLKESKTDLK